MDCPKCGRALKEEAKFKGLFTCAAPCDGLVLTGTGARDVHQEVCRLRGMSADQIIASWNKESPGDEW